MISEMNFIRSDLPEVSDKGGVNRERERERERERDGQN
jgi:hypothetical protein